MVTIEREPSPRSEVQAARVETSQPRLEHEVKKLDDVCVGADAFVRPAERSDASTNLKVLQMR